jgi:hypothetical protein
LSWEKERGERGKADERDVTEYISLSWFFQCQPAKMSRRCRRHRLPQSWEKEKGERGKAELRCNVTEYIFLSLIQSVATSFSFNGAIRDRAASAGGHHEEEAEGARKEAGKDGVRGRRRRDEQEKEDVCHGRRKEGKEEKLNCVVTLRKTYFCLKYNPLQTHSHLIARYEAGRPLLAVKMK